MLSSFKLNAETLTEALMELIRPEVVPSEEARQVEVTRLINELSVVGWPALSEAVASVLAWDWEGEAEAELARRVVEREAQREAEERAAEEEPRAGWGPLYLSAPLKSALARARSLSSA